MLLLFGPVAAFHLLRGAATPFPASDPRLRPRARLSTLPVLIPGDQIRLPRFGSADRLDAPPQLEVRVPAPHVRVVAAAWGARVPQHTLAPRNAGTRAEEKLDTVQERTILVAPPREPLVEPADALPHRAGHHGRCPERRRPPVAH